MRQLSIRWKLTAWYGSVLGAVLVFLVLTLPTGIVGALLQVTAKLRGKGDDPT